MISFRKSKGSRNHGFTMVELMIVIVVIGILANIAIAAYQNGIIKAKATKIITDFNFVESAASRYAIENAGWPGDLGPGLEPPELALYLNSRINWNTQGSQAGTFQYEWENWLDSGGNPTKPETGVAIGFSVRTSSPAMITALQKIWDRPIYVTLDRVTFAILPA